MKHIVLICLFAISAICTSVSAKQDPWLSDFATEIQTQALKRNIPGYTFVFVEKGQPPQVVTFGSTQRRGLPIDSNTVFRLASVSKTFTGVLMAKMVEQNSISWQTPIPELVPQYGFAKSKKTPLLLEHILSQSSGYTPNAYDNLIEADYSLKRVLGQLAKLKPLCSPGRCYTYQNALFGVLEDYYAQQNTSYAQVLDQQIIQPLRMPNASAGREGLLQSQKWARPHIAISRENWRQARVHKDYYRFSPAAGVNASIADLTIWLQAMLGGHPDIISPSVIETVTTPRVKTKREMRRRDWRQFLKDAHYGYGWRIYDFKGHKLNYHGGWVEGYRADVAFAPEQGVGYAMLMNAESNLINSFTAKFWQAYFEYAERPVPPPYLAEKTGD